MNVKQLIAGVSAAALLAGATATYAQTTFGVGANNNGVVVQGQYQKGPVQATVQVQVPPNGGPPQFQGMVTVTK